MVSGVASGRIKCKERKKHTSRRGRFESEVFDGQDAMDDSDRSSQRFPDFLTPQ